MVNGQGFVTRGELRVAMGVSSFRTNSTCSYYVFLVDISGGVGYKVVPMDHYVGAFFK